MFVSAKISLTHALVMRGSQLRKSTTKRTSQILISPDADLIEILGNDYLMSQINDKPIALLDAARSAITKSEIPANFQSLVVELVEKFGVDWHLELDACEERLGPGVGHIGIDILEELSKNPSPELQEAINSLNETLKEYAAKFEPRLTDPLEGYAEFIEQLEFIDWEDEHGSDYSLKQEMLRIWYDDRIDFFRSIKKFKLAKARERALCEVESINIGGEEFACRICGVYFYDHFDKHFRLKSLYCSTTCEENADLQCIQCHSEFTVGQGTAGLRMLKLSGFCTLNCESEFRNERQMDQAYVNGMRQRAFKFKVAFDETITRREVFKRGTALCSMCGRETHFESKDEWSPLLATVDHIIPWTKGGSHVWENVQLCCFRCNIVKGNR